MKKDKNAEIKSPAKVAGVAAESKKITKKQKNKSIDKLEKSKAALHKVLDSATIKNAAPGDKQDKTKGPEASNKKLKQKAKKQKKPKTQDGNANAVKTPGPQVNGKAESSTESKSTNSNELSKIEKKKAKKLAQKLKKKEKKANAPASGATDPVKHAKKVAKQLKKKQPPKATSESTNGIVAAPEKPKPNEKAVKKKLKKELKQQKQNKEPRPRDPIQEAATVFVGNLPVNTKRPQLSHLFKPFGQVNCVRFRTAAGKTIFKHKQRKKAGTLNAYVVMQSVEEAKKALEVNGTEFKGNVLRVTPAENKGHESGDTKHTVFVGNLKYTATEEKLREIFSSCGEIDYIRCLREGDKGCKGVAYVCFKAPEAVGLALELDETMLDERPIHVERYSVKKLGAKDARAKEAATNNASKKPITGAQKRLAQKQKQNPLSKKDKTKTQGQNGENAKANKSKKSEFRGVKVGGGVAKKQKKKKKSNNEMHKLAKKIAPKSK